MNKHYQRSLFLGLIFILSRAWFLCAEDPTSKYVSLAPIPSNLAPSSTGLAVQLEIRDQAIGGTLIYAEAHTVDTDDGSNITNDTNFADLLLGRPNGLEAANFPYGSSRYLDVTQGGVSVLPARLPLYGSVFSLAASGNITDNLTMVNSTPTAGNILKGGALFLHNFGMNNTFLGQNAGNLTMTGGLNTASGFGALFHNATGERNTASGVGALLNNTTGFDNTASGDSALADNTTGESNTASGSSALRDNATGSHNTAIGDSALVFNTTGDRNTASGAFALQSNTTGSHNTAIGAGADVSTDGLTNATAIGFGAVVNASNKIRLGNTAVTVVEGPPYSTVSDKTKKENFQPVDGEEVLRKIRTLSLTSWNYIGHDPKEFRHYGPVAQEFFAAFGHDGIGTIGTPTTINSVDMAGILMIAVQALEQHTAALAAENAELRARLEALEGQTGR